MVKTSTHDDICIIDFDHTIYNGDATLDFYYFCAKRHPIILRFLPLQLWSSILFALGVYSKEVFKSDFMIFVKDIKNISNEVEIFWKIRRNRIFEWYEKRNRHDDIIISASPAFILEPIAQELKVKALIATDIDMETGRLIGKNCNGPEKVRRLNEALANARVTEAYSDHESDIPMLGLAEKAYVIHKGKIYKYEGRWPR